MVYSPRLRPNQNDPARRERRDIDVAANVDAARGEAHFRIQARIMIEVDQVASLDLHRSRRKAATQRARARDVGRLYEMVSSRSLTNAPSSM